MNDLGKDRLGAYGDEFYQKLMAAHDDLDQEQSSRFNARLILLLANRIGDRDVLEAALSRAAAES